MPATLNTLRVSKRGLPLLLILSEDSNNYRHQFEAHIAFPEKPRTGEAVETVASIRVLVEEDDNGKSLAVARQVVREAALLHGYGLQASDQFPADTVVIEKVRDVSVSAWLAMGFFPGLVRPVNLNDEILSKLRSLGRVYDFKDYAPKPR
jgi:hypothetical protein